METQAVQGLATHINVRATACLRAILGVRCVLAALSNRGLMPRKSSELIDSEPRKGTIRGLEGVLKDGCLAQLVERRPYKA